MDSTHTTLLEHPLDTCGWKIVQNDCPYDLYQGSHKWKSYFYFCQCHGGHHLWTYMTNIADGSAISSDGLTHAQILSQEHCDAAPL